jgi:hypothetical protein
MGRNCRKYVVEVLVETITVILEETFCWIQPERDTGQKLKRGHEGRRLISNTPN